MGEGEAVVVVGGKVGQIDEVLKWSSVCFLF